MEKLLEKVTKEKRLGIPSSIEKEHAELLAKLEKATREPGELGKVASMLEKTLHLHFKKEEKFALPPLGILSSLQKGTETPEDSAQTILLVDQMKKNFDVLIAEHKEIHDIVKILEQEAVKAGRGEYVEFCHQLMDHAKAEEEVWYPGTIIIGEYLRLKIAKKMACEI